MKQCYTCGNGYDKCFELILNNNSYSFGCFECAIHKLAPTCKHCGCRVIGHGVEEKDTFYCCAHCSKAKGIHALKDRA